MRSCLIPSKELPTKPAQYILHGLLRNGGEMCYLLAYKRPDIFTAVAPVAGLTLEWMYRELETNRPIPLFEIHVQPKTKPLCGNGDPNNEGGWGKYIAVPIAVNYWAIQNRCTHEITDTIASIDSLSNAATDYQP